ncbi:indole-3-glycerol phosphate synthase TrpC [Deferrisoma camini]|uniref:indole-3-glycerol phosphate synthase TrpC n=1 Tax=Deferrisoma camini TaxID=1035120 RepID=UPI00046D6247|nr:indole-3-glycerol phosphate synthase TrpC [Deferrisoma camini]
MTILDRIVAARRRRVDEAQEKVPLEFLWDRCGPRRRGADPLERLASWPPDRRAVIAEVKRRSPSKGDLRPDLDPAGLARAYAEAGAFAVSVLTEPDFFGGSLEDLRAVRGAVDLPVLRKDFVIDPYQVWEARAWGADLVLLIAAVLGPRLGEFVELCRLVGVEPLVEVHDGDELDAALAAGARFVGINNRNLATFEVSIEVTRRLLPRIPADRVVVSESGLGSARDLDLLEAEGARAFLIGEALVTAPDPGAALRALVERGP